MRHETCLACRIPGAVDPGLRQMIAVAESPGPDFMHHHHTMECGGCGSWWFDDVVIGGLGIPVTSHRDTEPCPCDEGLAQYTQRVVHVPEPEARCACTRAQVDQLGLPIRLRSRPGALPRHQVAVRRDEATADISARLRARDAFIVSVPPDLLAEVTRALKDVREATCYLDCGLPGVTKVSGPHLAEAATMARSQPPGTATAVFVIPKTIGAGRLAKLLSGSRGGKLVIPGDGSQDLLLVHGDEDQICWPTLLIEAIGRTDPGFAAQIAANDLRRMS